MMWQGFWHCWEGVGTHEWYGKVFLYSDSMVWFMGWYSVVGIVDGMAWCCGWHGVVGIADGMACSAVWMAWHGGFLVCKWHGMTSNVVVEISCVWQDGMA